MKTPGMRTFGALFLVLLFLMGAWVVHPEGSVQAQQGKPIQGVIAQDGNVTIVPDATVTLVNVHSLVDNRSITTGRGNGKLYKFTDATPGYYSIKVTASGYFDSGTKQPFRYDGDTLIQLDFNLTKWPDRNNTLDVLVTDTYHTAHNESIYFPRYNIVGEDTIATFDTNHTFLAKTPVVRIKSLTFYDSNGPTYVLPRTEYNLANQWSGRVDISNTSLYPKLAQHGTPYALKADYTYTATAGQLNHTPVAEMPYMVFKNSNVWDPVSGDWDVDINLGTLTINRNLVWGSDSVSMSWDSTEGLSGARVTLYETVRKQVIDGRNSNGQGWANFSVWTGNWEVWASKADYETTVKQFAVPSNQTVRVAMPSGIYVDGSISDRVIGFLTDDSKFHAVAYLYNINPLTPPVRKVVKAIVTKGTFTFKAYPGQFLLIVDADWHKASVTRLDIGTEGMTVPTIYLDVSIEEKVDAVMAFKQDNWSLMSVYQNYTLNRDSQIPGLELSFIRDAFLQIDYALGNRDGTLTSDEVNKFGASVQQNGSSYIDTDGLLTTNGYKYLSNEISDSSSADTEFTATPDIDLTQSRSQPIWINTTTLYTVKDVSYIPYMKPQYYVNFTGAWDTNTTVYRNNTYTVDLPHRYEMTSTTSKSPGLEIKNFTRIELDPGTGTGNPTANMIIKLSANGTARARVKGPAGNFQELNTSLDNYTAVVMASYNITYSADQSTDPIGKISDANFTWFFGIAGDYRYGMDAVYNYTAGGRHDNCMLTIREAGGNITTRPFHLIVDDTPPIARLWANRSAGGSTAIANGTTLRVNESAMTRFDSLRSIDKTYLSYDGSIASAHWDFNGDGIEDGVQSPGKIVNHSFETPGNFTLKMWVFDSVGHRSVNATMNIIVNDTTPPSINFVVYQDKAETIPATQLTETVDYYFNASSTTDNYDSISNLTFRWDFGDGSFDQFVNGTGLDGYNVTHRFAVFNNSYKVKLNVSDTGFYQNTPNYDVLTKDLTVQASITKRPSISIKMGSFSANPSNPEEGQDVTITVTVNNDKSHGRASNVGVKLSVRTGSTYSEVSISPKFLNNSVEVNNSLEPGQDKQIRFVWKADTTGSRSLKVTVTDPEEPYTWASDNSIEGTVNVKEAGWKMPLIIFGFIFVIFGIPILWYVIKRVRAGELKLPRRKKGEEEESKKEEVEKKRL